jgi:hypothetical protein
MSTRDYALNLCFVDHETRRSNQTARISYRQIRTRRGWAHANGLSSHFIGTERAVVNGRDTMISFITAPLGRVDGFEENDAAGERDESSVVLGCFLAA